MRGGEKRKMFSRKETWKGRGQMLMVGVMVAMGAKDAVNTLIQGTSAEAAELPESGETQADQAFLDHVFEAKYSGFQLVDQAVEARREVGNLTAECVDSDHGIDPLEPGTTSVGTLSFTDRCFCDWSCFLGYTKPYLVEYSCSRKDRIGADFIHCEDLIDGAFCEDGSEGARCVAKLNYQQEGLVTIARPR